MIYSDCLVFCAVYSMKKKVFTFNQKTCQTRNLEVLQ